MLTVDIHIVLHKCIRYANEKMLRRVHNFEF